MPANENATTGATAAAQSQTCANTSRVSPTNILPPTALKGNGELGGLTND